MTPTLTYIMSPSFSGSTLLTLLLAQHPRIATVGELKENNLGKLSEYRCSCGELLLQCPFWKAVSERCAERGIEFSVARFGTSLRGASWVHDKLLRASVRGRLFETVRGLLLRSYPSVRTELHRLLQRNLTLTRVIAELQGGDIVVDGSKDPARLLHFVASGLWKVKVICLHRDGRGVINSYMKHYGVDVRTAVREWQHTVSELGHMRSRLPPEDVIDIQYENLCRDTESNMAAIWSWLGIEPKPIKDLQYGATRCHVIGNQMRLKSSADIRLDEAWRAKLTPEQIRYFELKAGATNRALGYA